MARAVWTGSLSFGLVNVPVGLFAATGDKAIRFNQFQAGTADRVRNKRVNERSGEEVPYNEIVKGYDLGGGEYVILTPEEVASVAPGRSHTIDVTAFVDLDEIDPVYFDRPYYLAPAGKPRGSERAYALLREAMLRANKVALATFVLRERQYLVAVRPRRDVLVVETLLYADEVRDPVAEIDTLPVEAEFDERELDMAELLIGSMEAEWDPSQFHDAYRERLEGLIEQKRSGEAVSVQPPEPEAAPVVDLLSALEASVRAARGARTAQGDGAQDGIGRVSGRGRAGAPQTAQAPGRGRATAPGGGRGAGDAMAGLSKAELVQRAADLDIAGRSKMSKDELEAAVRSATPRRRRKAS